MLKGTTLKVLEEIRKDPRASYRELMQRCDVATTSVIYYHIEKLVNAGLITKRPGSRGLFIGDRSRGRTGGNRVVRDPDAKERVYQVITEHPEWSHAEIMKATGVSNVTYYVKKLGAEGRIEVKPKSRKFQRMAATRYKNAKESGDMALPRMSKKQLAARIDAVVENALQNEACGTRINGQDVISHIQKSGLRFSGIRCHKVG